MILMRKIIRITSLTILYLILILSCILAIKNTFYILISNLNIIGSLFVFISAVVLLIILIGLLAAFVAAKIYDMYE